MQSMRRKRDKNLEYVSDAATRSTATFTGSAGGAAASVGTVLIPAAADKVENNTRSRAIVLLGSWIDELNTVSRFPERSFLAAKIVYKPKNCDDHRLFFCWGNLETGRPSLLR